MKISRARTNSLSLDVQIFHYMKKLHAIITIKKKMKTKIKRTNLINQTQSFYRPDSIFIIVDYHYSKRNEIKKKKKKPNETKTKILTNQSSQTLNQALQ